jgi:hypothetical protein
MTKVKMTTLAAALLGMGTLCGAALASNEIDAAMSRVAGASGSGHTVIDQCGGGTENWDAARASIEIDDNDVKIKLKDAKPDTLYTVWVRLKGSSLGTSFGGSPVTNGGATPLSPTSGLHQLIADWVGSGSPTSPNGFHTDANGNGSLRLDLDFPVLNGAYPFNRMSADDLALAQTKRPEATAVPAATVNPADSGIGGPFLIRMVSHCQDGLSHGLSPANREAWFQYP